MGEARLFIYATIRLLFLRKYSGSIYYLKKENEKDVFVKDENGQDILKKEYSFKSFYEQLKKDAKELKPEKNEGK